MQNNSLQTIFKNLIKEICGINCYPLGSIQITKKTNNAYTEAIQKIFLSIVDDDSSKINSALEKKLFSINKEAKKIFIEYYSIKKNKNYLENLIGKLQETEDSEERARLIGEIWVPELNLSDEEIIKRWQLQETTPNPSPIKPTEVTIQLNALYSLPERIPGNLSEALKKIWNNIKDEPMSLIANYDHPVPIFCDNKNHELVKCLDELNQDIAFEKEKNILSAKHKLLVTVSISVTHDLLDPLANQWIKELLYKQHYPHLKIILLSEENINLIKEKLLKKNLTVFSVFGKYAFHFNALKYSQLLLEKAYQVRAGFKIDTDEGIRSKDIFQKTGKTWLEILCHPLWGGQAIDYKGNKVNLGINAGEYINSKDVDKHGYQKAFHMPEVPLPVSFISSSIMFNKAYAQGRVTALYNTFKNLEENISHPVVKGGGYGITNHALRKYTPFTLSMVGRAEDQQFYFHGLARGIRGIFHPDLRVAHYKESVQGSEKKQAGTKFLGDMYRLIIFEKIVSILKVKTEIDPFPGLFAGELARAQAFYHLLYRAFAFAEQGDIETTEYLLTEGIDQLETLKEKIDTGIIKKKLEEETREWNEFVLLAGALDEDKARSVLEMFTV